MKIKVKPEDFIVEEELKAHVSRGPYGLFLLEKRGWNTVDVLKRLCQRYHINFKDISAAGRKDRYALTRQYVAIKGLKNREFKDKNWYLLPVGEIDRPLSADLIAQNRFQITLRKLSENDLEIILSSLKTIANQGFPNYYGEQRFGTYDQQNGFVGEKIVKKQFKGAIKAFLCTQHPADKRPIKERKRFFFEHFDEPNVCYKRAITPIEKRLFQFLSKHPHQYLEALYLIPQSEIEFQLAMYQSYLWNEFLKALLLALGLKGHFIRGRTGPYFFPKSFSKEALNQLSQPLVTPGYKAHMPQGIIEKTYQQVLAKEGLKPSSFNFRQFRRAYLKPFKRSSLIKPKELKIQPPEADELYPHYFKLTVRFGLPAGSYATVLLKNVEAYLAAAKGYLTEG